MGWLPTHFLTPFLKSAVIFVLFHASGKTSKSNDFLNMIDKGYDTPLSLSLRVLLMCNKHIMHSCFEFFVCLI